MPSTSVTLTSVGRVGVITLNVPSKLNALTSAVADDFGRIVDTLRTDPSAYGAIVVTGAGRAFSAGGDLDWLRGLGVDTGAKCVVDTQLLAMAVRACRPRPAARRAWLSKQGPG